MILKIRTNDNKVVDVGSDDLKISNLINMLIESIEKDGEEIPLYNVSYCMFLKVLEYAQYYKKDPMKKIAKPLINNQLNIQQWYTDFISSQYEGGLYELLEAATYLDIEPLQELVCAHIASLINGTECGELKKIFGLDYETV